MKYDLYKHHRRSIRLKGYDYSKPGAYFITLCINKRLCLFGEIIDGKMILNDAGEMVSEIWQEIPKYYPGIKIDEQIVMPNHFHGIIILKNENVEAIHRDRPITNGQAQGPAPTENSSLSNVVGRFKSFTTYKYIEGIKQNNWEPFYKKLWQRNYYERIIRNENELNRFRKYIIENPSKWDLDKEYPIYKETIK